MSLKYINGLLGTIDKILMFSIQEPLKDTGRDAVDVGNTEKG